MDKKPCALGGGIMYSRPNNFNRMKFIKNGRKNKKIQTRIYDRPLYISYQKNTNYVWYIM